MLNLASPCEQWYLRIYNKRIHSSPLKLPQLYISGELHGDEQLGPNAVIEYVFPKTFLFTIRPYTCCKTELLLIQPTVPQSNSISFRKNRHFKSLSPLPQSQLPLPPRFSCRFPRNHHHAHVQRLWLLHRKVRFSLSNRLADDLSSSST